VQLTQLGVPHVSPHLRDVGSVHSALCRRHGYRFGEISLRCSESRPNPLPNVRHSW